jgi:hypothetical protein
MKWLRWHWFRDTVEDRWLAARAIEELFHPDGYVHDVEEFSSIPIKTDEALKRVQTLINQLLNDPSNFVEPPSVQNQYPELSHVGREKVIRIGHLLEEILPDYSLNLDQTKDSRK